MDITWITTTRSRGFLITLISKINNKYTTHQHFHHLTNLTINNNNITVTLMTQKHQTKIKTTNKNNNNTHSPSL